MDLSSVSILVLVFAVDRVRALGDIERDKNTHHQYYDVLSRPLKEVPSIEHVIVNPRAPS